MTFAEIKQRLEDLLKNPVLEEINTEAGELAGEFQALLEKRPVRADSSEEENDYIEDEHIESIRKLIREYRERKEEGRKGRADLEKKNLKEKQEILDELTKVISEEENISKAYQHFNELKEKWRTIGNVPYEKHHEIQQEFSRLSELFYYNMNIYKELRENDLRKNTIVKQEVIDKITALADGPESPDIEAKLRALQKEWDNTGAVLKDKWEEMRNQYWEAVRKVHEKSKIVREEKVKKQQEFLEAKKTLVERMKNILQKELNAQREWEKATEEVLAIQAEWKTIGFASREENEKIWHEFRSVCDSFFDKKKEFFGELKSVFDENKKKKQEIIAKADELKDSTDWKETSNKLIQLQKDWQKTGTAGKKAEHALWLHFRASCDHFFNKKKEHFAAMDLELDENLKKKEAFIESLSAIQIEGDNEAKIARLDELSKEYSKLGEVPFKEKERIQKAYRAAMDQLMLRLEIDPSQKEMAMFKAKVENLKQAPNSSYLLNKERQFLRERINKINEEIVRIENNLGFFNVSGKSDLLKDYENKIEALKGEIDHLKSKLKMVPKPEMK
jgi:hypothetical protein